MHYWQPQSFDQRKPFLQKRMQILRAVRKFFDSHEYWEVETPALQTMPCADMHIHGFRSEYFGPDLKKIRDFYLHTSPEFEMKKLLVAGADKIYQLCKVYRNAESTALHSPEFTLLEWYRTGTTYRGIMDECETMVKSVASALDLSACHYNNAVCNLLQPWERISVAEAFQKHAGIDLHEALSSTAALRAKAEAAGIRVIDSDEWGDIFHAIMAEKIEPKLGKNAPTFIYDYPASMACLSKKGKDPRYAERFELYISGVEIANAFTELTDAKEQRLRFVEEMKAKQQRYGFSYPVDQDFLSALEFGMPECGGIALGLDRLCMLLSGADSIEQVLWCAKPA